MCPNPHISENLAAVLKRRVVANTNGSWPDCGYFDILADIDILAERYKSGGVIFFRQYRQVGAIVHHFDVQPVNQIRIHDIWQRPPGVNHSSESFFQYRFHRWDGIPPKAFSPRIFDIVVFREGKSVIGGKAG